MKSLQYIQRKNEEASHLLIQPQLEIGKEEDEQEKEANTVADKVMKMSDPEEEEKKKTGADSGKIRMMSDGVEKQKMKDEPPISMMKDTPVRKMSDGNGGAIMASPKVEQGISSSKGNGQALPADTQQELGRKMNADFSAVNVHTDSNAAHMNKEIGAKAFTHGNDIYFNSGQYNPSSAQGKHLLAHELTHTVQQGATIRRSIEIGGTPYTPTTVDYSKYNKELLDKMHNGGLPPVNAFKTQTEFEDALNIRGNSITNMKDVISEDNPSVTFNVSPQTGYFELPPEFWEPTAEDWFQLKSGPDITPAKAIRSIFNNGKKESYLDCNMLMISLQYKSMLDSYGDDKFNLMFPGGKDLIISQAGKFYDTYPTVTGKHPFDEKNIYDDVLKTGSDSDTNKIEIDVKDPAKDLIPGDWVYFKNTPEYIKYISKANNLSEEQLHINSRSNPPFYGNDWQGEHALYVGDGKFQGFGLSGTYSYEEMINKLYDAFRQAILAYYDHPYYKQKYLDDGGEREQVLAKTQKDWKPAKIDMINRINTNNTNKLGK